MATTYDHDTDETLANEVSDLILDLCSTYLARPDQAATDQENDILHELIEWFREITVGFPGIDEVLHFHETRYNAIHCK